MSLDRSRTVLERDRTVSPPRLGLSGQRVYQRIRERDGAVVLKICVLSIRASIVIEHESSTRARVFVQAKLAHVGWTVNKPHKPERAGRIACSLSVFTNERTFERDPIGRTKNHDV